VSEQRPIDEDFTSAASGVGPLVLEARELSKDFRIGSGRNSAVLAAVRSVSLKLHRSAVVALVGESGSGKSTVARLLAGQETPTSGEILLDGASVTPSRRSSFRKYKSEVQMVFQDPFASINVVHRVRYPLRRAVRLHQHGLTRQQVASELVRLLEEVRLTPPSSISTVSRTSSLVANASASRSPAPSRSSRAFCLPMSQFRCSTSRFASRCST